MWHQITPRSGGPNLALMTVSLRPGHPADAEACGRICYEAFKAIAERHGFTPDFPDPRIAAAALDSMLRQDAVYSVVAERDGRVVGSNFLHESPAVSGVGPITVDPA